MKEYVETIGCFVFTLQLLLSLVGSIVAVYLVATQLIVVANSPIIGSVVVSAPSPQDIADLFAQQAASEGAITSLSCPCTVQSSPLSAVSSWNTTDDSLCVAMRGVVQPPLPPPYFPVPDVDIAAFSELLSADSNTFCIGVPPAVSGVPDPGWDALLAFVSSAATQGALFPPGPDFNAAVDALAERVQDALCGLAFGLLPPGEFYPNGVVPGTTLFNACAEPGSTELKSFLPAVLTEFIDDRTDYTSTDGNFVQLQQTRGLSLIKATTEMCASTAILRSGFLRAVRDVKLVSPLALAPKELGDVVEQLWYSALESRSAQTAGLVPGFAPDDAVAGLVDPSRGLINVLAPVWSPPASVPLSSYPFSSRHPFVRLDYIEGGSRQYYVTARSTQPTADVILFLGGEARVVANTLDVGEFPSEQTGSPHTTPGFDAYAPGPSWVPLGDDFLSLLDACGSGIPLSLDVHNLRPISGIENLIPYLPPPLDTIQLTQALCDVGFPPPASDDLPQPVLTSLPLRCPPVITWLGSLRAKSSFRNRTSPLRYTVAEAVAIFPTDPKSPPSNPTQQQIDFFQRIFNGDTAERADVLNTLMLDDSSTIFDHSPLQHYAACAPATCSYVTIDPQTFGSVALEAVSIYGGTATTVISAMGFAVLIVSFALRECCGYGIEAVASDDSLGSAGDNGGIPLKAWQAANPLNRSKDLSGVDHTSLEWRPR